MVSNFTCVRDTWDKDTKDSSVSPIRLSDKRMVRNLIVCLIFEYSPVSQTCWLAEATGRNAGVRTTTYTTRSFWTLRGCSRFAEGLQLRAYTVAGQVRWLWRGTEAAKCVCVRVNMLTYIHVCLYTYMRTCLILWMQSFFTEIHAHALTRYIQLHWKDTYAQVHIQACNQMISWA
jgi:hypothetical protein